MRETVGKGPVVWLSEGDRAMPQTILPSTGGVGLASMGNYALTLLSPTDLLNSANLCQGPARGGSEGQAGGAESNHL